MVVVLMMSALRQPLGVPSLLLVEEVRADVCVTSPGNTVALRG